MIDNQLFKKIQLAFDHVRIPLKSELNFSNSLIINNLLKFNSLQTFVFWRPETQHFRQKNDGTGLKQKSDFVCLILPARLPPHSHPALLEIIDNQ